MNYLLLLMSYSVYSEGLPLIREPTKLSSSIQMMPDTPTIQELFQGFSTWEHLEMSGDICDGHESRGATGI